MISYGKGFRHLERRTQEVVYQDKEEKIKCPNCKGLKPASHFISHGRKTKLCAKCREASRNYQRRKREAARG